MEDNFSKEFCVILWKWSAGDNANRALAELVGGGTSAGKRSFDSLVVGCRESVGLDSSVNFRTDVLHVRIHEETLGSQNFTIFLISPRSTLL